MAILASVAALLLISVSLEVQPTTAVCDASTVNTSQCSGCSTLVACLPGPTEFNIECASGQVCGNNGNNAMVDGCIDFSDSSNTELSKCSCDPFSTSPSYMADGQSKDPKAYLSCLPGDAAPQSVLCTGTDEVFLEGQIPPCGLEVQPATAVCDASTVNTSQCSGCSTLVACSPGPTEFNIECASGQVCGNNGNNDMFDACFDATDSSNTELSKCSCDPSSMSPSYMADGQSEDPKAYLSCLPGDAAPQSLLCTGTDEVFLEGQIPPCGPAPPTE